MRLGLVLGAGGPVGGGWEVGVLAALAEALDWDPGSASVIVGTSVGSRLGATLGHRVTPAAMLAHARAMCDEPPPKELATAFADLSGTRVIDRLQLELGGTGAASAAAVARRADELPGLDEQIWVDLIERDLEAPEWPELPLCTVSVSVEDGSRAVWTRESGVPLARAVASSMAVPGLNRPVTLDGRRYVDGAVWSWSNADVLAQEPWAARLDGVLFIGPCAAHDPAAADHEQRLLEAELTCCTDAGLAVSAILPGPRFRGGQIELLDPGARPLGIEIGLEDGAAAAARVAADFGLGGDAGGPLGTGTEEVGRWSN